MPTTYVRYAAALVFLLGATMLILRLANNSGGTGYDTIRLVHILAALGLISLFEISLSRAKRANQLSESGRGWGMAGRFFLTLALVMGLFLLLSLFFGFITGDGFTALVWVHATLGLLAVIIAGALFTRRYLNTPR